MSRTRLHVHAQGSGEPLVLIHGIGATWRSWAPVLGALAARHEVLALDLPGFGASPGLPPRVPRSVPALTDAVEQELDARGIGTASVAGFSMGGWIALELARRRRARDVVAMAPVGLGTPRENRRSRARLLLLRAAARAADPAARFVVDRGPLRAIGFGLAVARPRSVDPDDAAHALRAFARCPGFRRTLDWLFSHHAVGLEEIRCPVTVLWGTRDMILTPRQAPRFSARIPHADVRLLRGLGHLPMSDAPDLIARLILEPTGPARVASPT